MVIYLPAQAAEDEPVLDELTPREIVRELDKYVIGQADAKRAVAIALRNRIRRQKLEPEMADEVMPKNILMIGPTGVGKTELARRLAQAGQFAVPESGGQQVHRSRLRGPRCGIDDSRPGGYRHRHGARGAPGRSGRTRRAQRRRAAARSADAAASRKPAESIERTREKLRERLRDGKLDERMVEIDVKDRGPTFEITTQRGHRGDGHQPQGHAARPVRRPHRASAKCAWPRRSITWCRKKSRS